MKQYLTKSAYFNIIFLKKNIENRNSTINNFTTQRLTKKYLYTDSCRKIYTANIGEHLYMLEKIHKSLHNLNSLFALISFTLSNSKTFYISPLFIFIDYCSIADYRNLNFTLLIKLCVMFLLI